MKKEGGPLDNFESCLKLKVNFATRFNIICYDVPRANHRSVGLVFLLPFRSGSGPVVHVSLPSCKGQDCPGHIFQDKPKNILRLALNIMGETFWKKFTCRGQKTLIYSGYFVIVLLYLFRLFEDKECRESSGIQSCAKRHMHSCTSVSFYLSYHDPTAVTQRV